jgi:hypothetical protein
MFLLLKVYHLPEVLVTTLPTITTRLFTNHGFCIIQTGTRQPGEPMAYITDMPLTPTPKGTFNSGKL